MAKVDHTLQGIQSALEYVLSEYDLDQYDVSRIVGIILDGWAYDEEHLAAIYPNNWELTPFDLDSGYLENTGP